MIEKVAHFWDYWKIIMIVRMFILEQIFHIVNIVQKKLKF